MRSFQEGFKRARKAAGYTQKSFAEEYGCGLETVRTWEQGRHTPSLSEMEKLCKFFDCSFGYLMGETSIKTPDEEMRFACEYTGLSESSMKVLSTWEAAEEVVDQLLLQMYNTDPDTILGKKQYKHESDVVRSVLMLIYTYFTSDYSSISTSAYESVCLDGGTFYLDARIYGDTLERIALNQISDGIKEINRKIHNKGAVTKGND